MDRRPPASATDTAASQPRGLVMAQAEGVPPGDEREGQRLPGVSRTTLRQVACRLEREGIRRSVKATQERLDRPHPVVGEPAD